MEVLGLAGKDACILEVGCGTGRLIVDARAEGYNISGLDASPHMLEQLRAKFGPDENIETVVGEAAKIPQPDETYDAVYAIRVLNQTESPAYALDAVTYNRGTARTFFIATPPRHAALVTARVAAFLEESWSQHFLRDGV